MDLTTTIIGLALLALFILPVVIISKSGKRKRQRFLTEINRVAEINGITVNDFDIWNESAIAVDESKKTLIFVDESHGEPDIRVFTAAEIRFFKTSPETGKNARKEPDYSKENRVEFVIGFRDISKPELHIVFFISGFGSFTKKEKHLFEKWSALIQKIIS